jgi:hypothetical protein
VSEEGVVWRVGVQAVIMVGQKSALHAPGMAAFGVYDTSIPSELLPNQHARHSFKVEWRI